MKYAFVFIFCIISVIYLRYFVLYEYDEMENSLQHLETLQIQDYLTPEFWENVTPEQLKEKLKSIENVNEVRPGSKQNMLHLLVLHGQYPEMVDLLISAGVDYNMITGSGALPFHYAIIKKDYEWTKDFLKYDMDINAVFNGTSPLFLAVYYRQPTKVIQLLLEKGADPHFRTPKTKDTILRAASAPNIRTGVSFINPEVVQLLLDHKVDITIKDNKGKTALDYMKKNKEFIKTKLFKELSAQFPAKT